MLRWLDAYDVALNGVPGKSERLLPLEIRRSRWPWHLEPWQPRFCTNDGQCLPPFSGSFKMVRVRVIIPVPHVTSHPLHTPHSLTVQSITATKREIFIWKNVNSAWENSGAQLNWKMRVHEKQPDRAALVSLTCMCSCSERFAPSIYNWQWVVLLCSQESNG